MELKPASLFKGAIQTDILIVPDGIETRQKLRCRSCLSEF